MFQKYPYTDYHELNLDYIMKLARESMGLHLEVSGNELLLKNDLNETLSHVVIAYADKALYDNEGNEISAYIINAGRDGRAIAFTKGNGDVVSVALPDDAIYDKNGKEITSYIAKVDVAGNKLRVTDGDGNAYTFTCPYSTSAGKATTDDNGKNLTTYVADINVSGNDIVVKDGEGNVLRTFTVAYATNATNAEKAVKDGDGDVIKSTYGAELIVDGTKIGLEAKDGTTLNKITVPFATLATDATNAIESVTVTGNQLQFRTFGGTVTNITVPYALKATNDASSNEIIKSYVADVTNDALTGKITFLAMDGSTIAELIPTVDSAVHDSYDNLIADFVKTIAVSAGSDYVTVTHGTGTTETLLIDYANRAWKDTNGNIIKNVYLKSLECLPDSDTGHYVLVGYNGENSEILRIEIYAYMAQRAIGDEDGNQIKSSYVASGAMNGYSLELKAKDNTVLSTIPLTVGESTYVYEGNDVDGKLGLPTVAIFNWGGQDNQIDDSDGTHSNLPIPYNADTFYGNDIVQVMKAKTLQAVVARGDGSSYRYMNPIYAETLQTDASFTFEYADTITVNAGSFGTVNIVWPDGTRITSPGMIMDFSGWSISGCKVLSTEVTWFPNIGYSLFVYNTTSNAVTFTAGDELICQPLSQRLYANGTGYNPEISAFASDFYTGLAITRVIWRYTFADVYKPFIASGLDADATKCSASVVIIPGMDKSASDYSVKTQYSLDKGSTWTDGNVPSSVTSGQTVMFKVGVYLTADGDSNTLWSPAQLAVFAE